MKRKSKIRLFIASPPWCVLPTPLISHTGTLPDSSVSPERTNSFLQCFVFFTSFFFFLSPSYTFIVLHPTPPFSPPSPSNLFHFHISENINTVFLFFCFYFIYLFFVFSLGFKHKWQPLSTQTAPPPLLSWLARHQPFHIATLSISIPLYLLSPPSFPPCLQLSGGFPY